jgi:hypothetical protein
VMMLLFLLLFKPHCISISLQPGDAQCIMHMLPLLYPAVQCKRVLGLAIGSWRTFAWFFDRQRLDPCTVHPMRMCLISSRTVYYRIPARASNPESKPRGRPWPCTGAGSRRAHRMLRSFEYRSFLHLLCKNPGPSEATTYRTSSHINRPLHTADGSITS